MSVDTKALRNEAQEIWTTKWASIVITLCDEIDRLRNDVEELDLLRNRPRPRSIKDEPPQPDAFERWFDNLEETEHCDPAQSRRVSDFTVHKFVAKTIWNAAIQSTKSHEKTNPVD